MKMEYDKNSATAPLTGEYKSGFETESHISLEAIVASLLLVSIIIFFLSIIPPNLTERYKMLMLAVLVAGEAGITWRLDKQRPLAARWFLVLGIIALILGAAFWLAAPGALALLSIPPMLATILIGQPAGVITALGATAIFFLQSAFAGPDMDPAAIVMPVMITWATLGVTVMTVRMARRVAQWSWGYYQQAKDWREETRDRKIKMEQTLDDLARANLQLTRLNILAQNLRQVAEDARATKERFVANVSHELRTPLNMVIGFSEMILQSPETYGERIPPTLLADLEVIHRNAEHLSDLIDDVLDLSQIEADEVALAKEKVEIREIIDAAVTAVQPLFLSKNLYLEVDAPEDLPTVFCDRTRIREVLLNLLSNAGRFTEKGGVRIRAWREEDKIVISVADTGAGIADEDMNRLFQPFHQLGESVRQRYGGTGLGLSISKHFIELHEGTIWVESQQGVGTTFFFTLPLAPPISTGATFMRWLMPDWEHLEHPHPSGTPKVAVPPRFVVVEQGETLQRLLSHYENDVEIAAAASLEEALQAISDVPAQALLINDISVGDSLKQIDASATLPDGAPVIICSIFGTREASAALDAADSLVKPISRQELLGTLERLHIKTGTILIIDDDPDALQLFGRMLNSPESEYHVLLARDGEEALSILQQHRPEVILLDLIMPNVDGFQFLEIKKQDPTLRDIPVIITSALDPVGQPLGSAALAVTQKGGLSTRQLLKSIKALSKALSITSPTDDPKMIKDRTD
jgi:signal transduction histidine kinase/DNA-binding response OmpR family regulator